MGFFAPLISAVGPFMLWPVELLLPYPFIVEELFKGFIVYFILQEKGKKLQETLLIYSAVFFSLSESVLYIFNIFAVGNTGVFFLRLILTFIMHLGTFLIIFILAGKNIKLLPAGLILGAIIHYLYNALISSVFMVL